jgi:hypothetical protein
MKRLVEVMPRNGFPLTDARHFLHLLHKCPISYKR